MGAAGCKKEEHKGIIWKEDKEMEITGQHGQDVRWKSDYSCGRIS